MTKTPTRRTSGRLALLAFVLLAAFGSVAVASPGVSAQGASVEIHSRVCPVGYTGNRLFKDCHANPQAGVKYQLEPLTDTTGKLGNALFYDLAPGTVSIRQVNTLVDGGWVIICSDGDDQSVPASYRLYGGGILLDLPANAKVVCDWYTIPTKGSDAGGSQDGASITVHARLCPAGYAGGDLFNDCHGRPHSGAAFTLGNLSATTGASGNTFFYQLKPGSYRLIQPGAGLFQNFNVFCSLNDNGQTRFPLADVPDGVQIDLPANAKVICDWYSAPAPITQLTPNTLEIHTLACPKGYAGNALFETCHGNPVGGVSYQAAGPVGYDRDAVSNAQGVLQFEALLPGLVYVIPSFPLKTSTYVAYCSDTDGRQLSFTYASKGFELQFPATPAAVCDVYLIPS
ncbi:MAG: hypothetical protein ACR2OO_11630 [Thermomicrobiales bacterium]